MKGDKLVIQEGHVRAAQGIAAILLPQITGSQGRCVISISGESGSGKSEIAAALAERLAGKGVKTVILQQDDYFVFPPKTNAEMRRRDISRVGPTEVRLALLDQNLGDIAKGKSEIEKPLVIFDENRIAEETVTLEGIRVIIIDGTYATLLANVDARVFIDRTYIDTRQLRKLRAREDQDEFLESILEIEHRIISSHKARADIIVAADYKVRKAGKSDETGR